MNDSTTNDSSGDTNVHQQRLIDGLIAVITTHCEQQTMSSQEILGCIEYAKLLFWRAAMNIIDKSNNEDDDNGEQN